MRDPPGHLSQSERVTQQTFVESMVELYHLAQLDMLHRASLLIDPDAPTTLPAAES